MRIGDKLSFVELTGISITGTQFGALQEIKNMCCAHWNPFQVSKSEGRSCILCKTQELTRRFLPNITKYL
jgi:hypothetical protein